MTRWLTRIFFIGILLFFVGGWWLSLDCCWSVSYGNRNIWAMEWSWGAIHLGWEKNNDGLKGWQINRESAQDDSYPAFDEFGQIQIPFWFPTTIPSAILLWWAWHKTRPRGNAGAFPPERLRAIEKI